MTQLSELVDGIPDEYVKQPGQWRRKGDNGPPVVSDRDGVAVKSGPRAGQVWMHTYSRPSSFGKQVENTYNLEKWNERQVARGLAVPWDGASEVARVLVDGDPDDPAWKKAADGIVVEAKRRAGAMLAADRGTHGHNLTEDHDLDRSIISRLADGEDLGLGAPLQQAVVDAWQQLIADHFEVLAVEAACVFDEWRVAGTLDRIVRLKHDLEFGDVVIPAGTVIVLDIKTGGLKTDCNGLPQYWHSYAVQVAAYANSVPYDVDLERRGTWAWDVSTEHAVIAHIDIAGALDTDVVTAQLVYVDLVAGRFAGELVTHCKAWQKRKDIFSPTGHYLTAVTIAAPFPVLPAGDGIALTSPAAPARAALIGRAKTLVDAGHGLRLAVIWPDGVPGFKTDHQHTDRELEQIRQAIHEVEVEQNMPFVDEDMTLETPERHLSVAPSPSTIDEGRHIHEHEYDLLKAAVASLPAADQFRIETWVAEANHAGTPFSLREHRTERRAAIAWALILCIEAGYTDDNIRYCCSCVLDSDVSDTPIGSIVGALTLAEAKALTEMADTRPTTTTQGT